MVALSVSNIAWSADEEPAVAEILRGLRIGHVEIAPTKVFDDPLLVSSRERASYQGFWADHGVEIVAFQSMLFGRDHLQLFGEKRIRAEMVDTLRGFLDLAGAMNVGRLVFGSPRNRTRPDEMSPTEAFDIAVEVFSVLGESAFNSGTVLCIEPNPPAYGCNFVVNGAEARHLVQAVDSPGFGLHLDSAGLTLAGDDLATEVTASGRMIKHFHISSPQLGQISVHDVDHRGAARALRAVEYDGFLSIEMRPNVHLGANVAVRDAVQTAILEYAAVLSE